MRIEVLGYGTMSAQARTYAEYRLFAELSRVADTNRVRHARVVLRLRNDDRADESVSCTVTVDVEGGEPLRIQTSAAHPYAAINRAAEQLRETSWPPQAAVRRAARTTVAPAP